MKNGVALLSAPETERRQIRTEEESYLKERLTELTGNMETQIDHHSRAAQSIAFLDGVNDEVIARNQRLVAHLHNVLNSLSNVNCHITLDPPSTGAAHQPATVRSGGRRRHTRGARSRSSRGPGTIKAGHKVRLCFPVTRPEPLHLKKQYSEGSLGEFFGNAPRERFWERLLKNISGKFYWEARRQDSLGSSFGKAP